MEEILILATVIAPVTTGLVQMVKSATQEKLHNYLPLLSLVIGLLIGLAAVPFGDVELYARLWAGGIAGLGAVGLYEGIDKTVKAVKE